MSFPAKGTETISDKENTDLGSRKTFARLFVGQQIQLYRYLYAMTGGPQQLVEDLTAEAFSRAWRARRSFKGNSAAARRWLLAIARNLALDHLRKAARERAGLPSALLELPESLQAADSPEIQHLAAEQREMLWRALQILPDETREILVLRYILDWRVKDIANHMGKKESAVSMRISRGLDELQNLLTKDFSADKRGGP